MKSIFHSADSRGYANHGWLKTHHTFSFASYQDRERVHFGMLRVLNDDWVAPNMGFGKHPHDNMEIITIPLAGELQHEDSMGTSSVIRYGEVQVMSAGTGIYHSEFNASKSQPVALLQIWVFPSKDNVTPRYGQKMFSVDDRKNKFQLVVSPDGEAESNWVNQDTWFSLGNFSAGEKFSYKTHREGHGVYAFIISGQAKIAGQEMHKRDGLGIWETPEIEGEVVEDSEILLIEVPMTTM